MDSLPSFPTVWDEGQITRQLNVIQTQPNLLTLYVDQLRSRFILGAEHRTAQVRTKFLRSFIERLELTKQYETLIQDLKAMELEQDNRLLRLKLEQQELRARQQQASALDGLQLQKERLAIEVELATLQAKKTAIQNPERPDNRLTPEQRRAAEKREVEAHIADLKTQKAEALKVADEDERTRQLNAIEAALERAYERWSKLL